MVRKYLAGVATLGVIVGAAIALSPSATAHPHAQLTERQILMLPPGRKLVGRLEALTR